jgi:pyruvate dehydrogenase E1 component alpha subunit
MPREPIAKFQIDWLQILDENGNVDRKLLPKIPSQTMLKMYKAMLTARKFDEKLLALQRQGRVGTLAQVKGQEAQVGAAAAVTTDDWMIPSFRELAVSTYRGTPLRNFVLLWGGDERGNFAPETPHDLPIAIPVGSQILHATGIAWGMKYQNKKQVALCFFGDGATSEGDFHEGLNFAGVLKVPAIYVCQNNQYAISVPVSKQTAAKTLAQKAIDAGIEGIRVDGNDVFAVYAATDYAVQKARKGDGPTLIEMLTYRLSDHTTADDAKKYRSEAEVKQWEKKDPIMRFKKFLMSEKLWSDKEEEKLLAEISKKIEDEVAKAENMKPPELADMFRFMYAEMTPQLKEQLEYIKQFKEKRY